LIAHREQAGDLPGAIQLAHRMVAADPLREEAHHTLMRLLAAAGEPAAALRQYRELERLLEQELDTAPEAATRALARELATLVERETGRREDTAREGTASHPVAPPGTPLPTGTVTFLLTEIDGAALLRERLGDAFGTVLEGYHELLRPLFRGHGGHEVLAAGETLQIAFGRASDALAAAVAGQRDLVGHSWPAEAGAAQVRMALHTGEVEPGEEAQHSPAISDATRLLLAAHGGQILLSERSAALLQGHLPSGVQLADLGLYRLREGGAPERLFQVRDPEISPRAFPPPRALPGPAGNLPLQFTRFFGREAEIARLRELLLLDPTRLLTLTGAGGSGKTRLAQEVAARVREAFRNAVWFVPLVDLRDPRLILDKTLDALQLPRIPGAEPLERVAAFLAAQPSLLLLDNFEQLASEGAPIVRTLLERVPSLTCLVTSRQRLDLAGEREFPVPPLPTPDEPESPAALMRCESVRLFVDRAQGVRPDFQVTPGNAAAMAGLCRRLEGIPLAIELAAARAGVLTPAQMLARLEHRFELLVSRRRDAEPRHRSLWAALEWSYELLAPELQRFFARLSVFRGGWTLSAAEAVCEEPSALECLEQLRECSLVVADEGGVEMRFRLLETVREYGHEHLSADEQAAVARRHASYYLALAEQAEAARAKKQTPGEERVSLDRLEEERANLRAALDWAVESGEAELGLRLAAALCCFWGERGDVAEGRQWLARMLGLAEEASSHRRLAYLAARAKVLGAAAGFAYPLISDQGDITTARSLTQERLAIGQALEDRQVIADSLGTLGRLALWEGDLREARSLLEESLAIARQLGDPNVVAFSLHGLGHLARFQRDWAAARSFYHESMDLRRGVGNLGAIHASLVCLGQVAQGEGDYQAARALYEELLRLEHERGNRAGVAVSLVCLADVARQQKELPRAAALCRESLALWRELGNKEELCTALLCAGSLAALRGDYEEARSHDEEWLAIERAWGNQPGIAHALKGLGEVARLQKDYGRAAILYGESLALWQELGNSERLCELRANLGYLAADQGDWGQARADFLESLTGHREAGNQQGVALCLAGLAVVAGGRGECERATRLFGAAEALHEAPPSPGLVAADQADHDRYVAAARAGLEEYVAAARAGLDEATFAAAWAQGQAMSLERAVTYALEGEDI
jgi:predicted ATPase